MVHPEQFYSKSLPSGRLFAFGNPEEVQRQFRFGLPRRLTQKVRPPGENALSAVIPHVVGPKDVCEHLHALFHIFNGDIFETTMVVVPAGAEVGAGQAFVGESGTVRAAPDGYLHRVHPRQTHGFLCSLHHIHHRLNVLPHIEVAVLHGKLHRAFPIFCIDKIRRSL